jgi:hypothetical protein
VVLDGDVLVLASAVAQVTRMSLGLASLVFARFALGSDVVGEFGRLDIRRASDCIVDALAYSSYDILIHHRGPRQLGMFNVNTAEGGVCVSGKS